MRCAWAALLLLPGCTPGAWGEDVRPRDAIFAAADAAPRGVSGFFAMRVKAAGRERGRVYLNSERDYRDQRNLTINIAPAAAEALARRYGSPPDTFFVGKPIRVRGTAQRVRIGFFAKGEPTHLYYYQTHVVVSDPNQIQLRR